MHAIPVLGPPIRVFPGKSQPFPHWPRSQAGADYNCMAVGLQNKVQQAGLDMKGMLLIYLCPTGYRRAAALRLQS